MMSRSRPGYVFLLTILFVGAIATTSATALVLIGLAAQRNAFVAQQSSQALLLAQTCVERTLRSLRLDSAYPGAETFTLPEGSCEIRTIGGTGNLDRTVCAEGKSGNAVRRLEVSVALLLPLTKIDSWREVNSFSLCL